MRLLVLMAVALGCGCGDAVAAPPVDAETVRLFAKSTCEGIDVPLSRAGEALASGYFYPAGTRSCPPKEEPVELPMGFFCLSHASAMCAAKIMNCPDWLRSEYATLAGMGGGALPGHEQVGMIRDACVANAYIACCGARDAKECMSEKAPMNWMPTSELACYGEIITHYDCKSSEKIKRCSKIVTPAKRLR